MTRPGLMTPAIEQPAAVHVDQADALTLLYAAVTGDRSEVGRLVRGLLLLHLTLPADKSAPPCTYCRSTDAAAPDSTGAEHCHCRCDVCTCGDPLCVGPCDTLAAMLDALVLHGIPAAAIDVPRALAKLHLAAVRRIVTHPTARACVIVDPADTPPAVAQITIGNGDAVEPAVRALRAHGYECIRRDIPGPVDAVRLVITYRH